MLTPFHYIYGPVYSWRLGNSLGVDPLSDEEKICNMDCVYCQLGRTKSFPTQRREYVSTSHLVDEIKRIPVCFIDYITFSGRGEPTLAKNLGEMIQAVKAIRHEKVAVITNSVLMDQKDVREDLNKADFVLAKLDAVNQGMLGDIDGHYALNFNQLINGIISFRKDFHGKLALQIMLIKENIKHAQEFASWAKQIMPDEVQLNTPLRSCSIEALSRQQLDSAKHFFKDFPVVTCFDTPLKETSVIDEKATAERHGRLRKTRYVY